MARDSELKVSSFLQSAIKSEVGEPTSEHDRGVVILAAYLDSLSEAFGFSEHYEGELIQRAARPSPFLPYLRHYLAGSDGLIEPETVRNQLYEALAHIADIADSTAILKSGQIYWALSHERKTRTRLVFKGGERVEGKDESGKTVELQAVIWVEPPTTRGRDFATLRRTERADGVRGMGFTSGAALRKLGPVLAILAAREIINGNTHTPPSLTSVTMQHDGSGRPSRIVFGVGSRSLPNASRSDTSRTASLDLLARDAEMSGMTGEAAVLLDALVKILRERSITDPDQEGPLASAALRAGIAALSVGRPEEALKHFATTVSISETLSALMKEEPAHKRLLAFALTLIGLLDVQAHRENEGEVVLKRAVTVSQELTDRSNDDEGQLAIALTMLGNLHLKAGHHEDASAVLDRAVAINQKLSERNPDDLAARLLLASSLTTLGTHQWVSDRISDAEATLARAVSLSERLTEKDPEDPTAKLVLANALTAIGGLYVNEDKEMEAEQPLRQAVRILTGLAGNVGSTAAPWTTALTPLVLAGTLQSLGFALLFTEREAEAEETLKQAVEILDPRKDVESRILLVNLLDVLAAVYTALDRTDDASHCVTRVRTIRDQLGPAAA